MTSQKEPLFVLYYDENYVRFAQRSGVWVNIYLFLNNILLIKG